MQRTESDFKEWQSEGRFCVGPQLSLSKARSFNMESLDVSGHRHLVLVLVLVCYFQMFVLALSVCLLMWSRGWLEWAARWRVWFISQRQMQTQSKGWGLQIFPQTNKLISNQDFHLIIVFCYVRMKTWDIVSVLLDSTGGGGLQNVH